MNISQLHYFAYRACTWINVKLPPKIFYLISPWSSCNTILNSQLFLFRSTSVRRLSFIHDPRYQAFYVIPFVLIVVLLFASSAQSFVSHKLKGYVHKQSTKGFDVSCLQSTLQYLFYKYRWLLIKQTLILTAVLWHPMVVLLRWVWMLNSTLRKEKQYIFIETQTSGRKWLCGSKNKHIAASHTHISVSYRYLSVYTYTFGYSVEATAGYENIALGPLLNPTFKPFSPSNEWQVSSDLWRIYTCKIMTVVLLSLTD